MTEVAEAQRPDCSPQRLWELAHSPAPDVQEAVAANPSAPPRAIAVVLPGCADEVLQAALEGPRRIILIGRLVVVLVSVFIALTLPYFSATFFGVYPTTRSKGRNALNGEIEVI